MPHPELVDVLGRRPLLLAADVPVHVDEARQHVHAVEVHLPVPRLRLRPPLGIGRDSRAADRTTRGSGSSRSRCRPARSAARPVPSINVTPRRISRLNGPSPSARGGAGRIDSSLASLTFGSFAFGSAADSARPANSRTEQSHETVLFIARSPRKAGILGKNKTAGASSAGRRKSRSGCRRARRSSWGSRSGPCPPSEWTASWGRRP